MMFQTQYDRVRERSNAGERFIYDYNWQVNERGVKELVRGERVDVYGQIQASKDSVDLNKMIEHYKKTGDDTIFRKKPGACFDATGMPKSYPELYQRLVDAEGIFNGLPVDVKTQFNNSPSQFFAAIGTDKFNKIFNNEKSPIISENLEKTVESEVVKSES